MLERRDIPGRRHIRILPLAILAMLLLPAILLAEPPASGFGEMNPEAPPETEQFAFLVGEWHCQARFLNGEGGYSEGEAKWTGYWILDGFAIQDDWISDGAPGGRKFHGTNIRSFNPETKHWDARWLPNYGLQWSYYKAEKVGDTMVMTGGEGSDPKGEYIERITFHDIEQDRWSWRRDRSYDGGETWVEGTGYIEATRVGSAAHAAALKAAADKAEEKGE